jgi:SpoVK/Ycf46/Vps4 family AAA+-type ATPase
MAFLGNPGTGKTTVARLYGKLLHDVGLLPSNKLIETDRSGLVGEYIGHSEKKTLDLIDLAEGGVLFIDEAYALADNYGPDRKGYGAEATDVIVKQMEDRRDRLVVIVAGYSKPMQQFLSINPGLRSRIPVILEFPDYTDDELVTIAERIAKRRLLILDENAKTKIRTVMANERDVEGFGNAREVENLLDAAQRNVIARVSSLGNLATSEETSTILSDDIPDATEPVAKRPIGFTPNSFS